jgi:DNA-binding response OmpR family regulator
VKLLLIEDDPRVSSLVERGLGREGFEVEVAADGRRGLERALRGGHELVLLDLRLPMVDGSRVLVELRRRRASVPVIVLSALGTVEQRVRALNDGADDFLVKPFSFDELLARVHALVRRAQGLASPVVEVGNLRVDLRARRVERDGKPISLTAKEFALLLFLLKNRDGVVTRAMIAEHVWGQHFGSFSNVIDVYVRYLRTKIDTGCERKLIHTMRGVGYVLSECHP